MSVYFWALLADLFRLYSAYLQGNGFSTDMHPDSLTTAVQRMWVNKQGPLIHRC